MHDGPRYVVEVQESGRHQSAESDTAHGRQILTFILEFVAWRAGEKGLVGMAGGQRIAAVVDGSASCADEKQCKSEDRDFQRL